jgi:N-acetyl-anhydromuramyl-L-alanine amidase AmpD
VGSKISWLERCVLSNDISANGNGNGNLGTFNQGWWSLATRRDAHPGRVGGNINAFSTVVHTTDMVPESWNGLINRWTTQPGAGNGAHFVIGRDANAGVIQLVPINRNANHAGGEGAGSYVAGAQSWSPNSCTIGIELHCAGGVQRVGGQWRFVENGVPQGLALPDADVIPDPAHANRGWHTVTDYQYQQIDLLLNALETVLDPLPTGCVATSIQPPPAWGSFQDARVVGHVSLTPSRRSDPWPPTCDWLRTR